MYIKLFKNAPMVLERLDMVLDPHTKAARAFVPYTKAL
jgi:hypothetical protein